MGFLDSEGLRYLVAKIKAAIPGRTSQLDNDAGFLTEHQDISGKLDTTATAAAAKKLATSRTIRTNLASTSTASFNGTANVTPGVTGVLPVANGGTGSSVEKYAPLADPEFTGSITLGYRGTGTVGTNSFTIGPNCVASGQFAFAGGFVTRATGSGSFTYGNGTISAADYQAVFGKYNEKVPHDNSRLIVGKGGSDTARANCFRVTDTDVYAIAYNTSGADYAELFEWADGNVDGVDRCGRFVTLEGGKIRLAGSGDDYILGIVSGDPSVVGDVYDDQWQGMFLHDVFGRPVWEDAEVPDQLGPDGEVLIPAHVERRQKLNPAYDGSQAYQPRSQRPEWDAVGLLGKLVAVDDGSCQVDGWCGVGEDGVAVRSGVRTRFRVMERLDERHVRVMML